MNIWSFFLQLLYGAAGGYLAGAGFTTLSWGAIGDLLIGVAGGALGGQILEHFWAGDAYSTALEIFLASIIGGCTGGTLMVVILGSIKACLRRQ